MPRLNLIAYLVMIQIIKICKALLFTSGFIFSVHIEPTICCYLFLRHLVGNLWVLLP